MSEPQTISILSSNHELLISKQALVKIADNKRKILRLVLSGGGCSGLKYNFLFLEKLEEECSENSSKIKDLIFNYNDVSIVIDCKSFNYLSASGFFIDYISETIESGFSFGFIVKMTNKNVKTCGCGKSFRI